MKKLTFIEVTELRAISADMYQWKLMKRNRKTDKKTQKDIGGYSDWVSYSYHPELGDAAKYLEKELQKTCGAQSFTELARMAERIHEMMKETFTLAESYKS